MPSAPRMRTQCHCVTGALSIRTCMSAHVCARAHTHAHTHTQALIVQVLSSTGMRVAVLSVPMCYVQCVQSVQCCGSWCAVGSGCVVCCFKSEQPGTALRLLPVVWPPVGPLSWANAIVCSLHYVLLACIIPLVWSMQ